jgi:hypothetical protein
MIHGLDGFASDMNSFKKVLTAPNIIFLAPTCNHWRTRDGIDAGARRILREIEMFLIDKNIAQISYIGHSLGGLYARRVVYLAATTDSPVNRLEQTNFITLATPHVGARQLARLFSDSFVQRVVPVAFGHTGRDVMLLDGPDNPIMLQMVSKEHLESLGRFKYLATYANVKNDISVHYCTAAIKPRNTHKLEKHSSGSIIVDDGQADAFRSNSPMMVTLGQIHDALNTLKWHKFACVFSMPLIAHVNIIDKSPIAIKFYNTPNPVVQHVAQHFAGLNIEM